jgi:dipeptidyl aminopeptidase/acylaminoacyl peptidase
MRPHPVRILACALSLAATTCIVTTAEARHGGRENYTVEHLLRLQDAARATFSDSGRILITERRRPLAEVRDTSLTSKAMVDREVLHFNVDGSDAAFVLPGDADVSTFASFSPDERKAAVWVVKNARWYAAIYDLETRALKTLDIVPELHEIEGNTALWISNEDLLYVVTSPLNQMLGVAPHRATIETMSRLAEQTWTGTEPSVTVVKSPDGKIERPRWLEASRAVRVVRVNAVTGKVTELLSGMRDWALQSPMLSHDRRYAAIIRRAELLPLEFRAPGIRDEYRTEMIIIDLRTNAIKKIIALENTYVGNHFMWSPAAAKLLYLTYRIDRDQKKEVRVHVLDVARDRITDVALPAGFEWWEKAEWAQVLPASWDGEQLLVRARKRGADRFDWYALERGKMRNITARLPQETHTYPIPYRQAYYFPLAGDLWRVGRDGAASNLTSDVEDEVAVHCSVPQVLYRPRCNWLWPFDGNLFVSVDQKDLERGVLALETIRRFETTGLVFLDLNTGRKEHIAAPNGTVQLFETSTVNREAVFYTINDDGDRLLRATAHGVRELWKFNTHLANVAPIKIIKRDRVTTTSKLAPRVELRDVLMLPADFQPGQRLPLVVQFYPDIPMYGDGWFTVENPRALTDLNMSIFAGAGYAVLNAGMAIAPKGVPGEPLEQIGPQVLEAVQWVIDEGYADPERMAVIGSSYGGYGVASVLATTDKFKAGIALKGLYNLVGLWGSMYNAERVFLMNGVLGMTALKGDNDQIRMAAPPWEAIDRYVRNSPMLQSHRINAPLLLIHGTNDFDAREAEQMFAALARQGKVVEFARYWGEGHGIGGVANTRDYYTRMLRFLDEHIGATSQK